MTTSCDHPMKTQQKVRYGFMKCGRCDADLAPAGRVAEVQHTRNWLRAGDPVRCQPAQGPSFRGVFLYAEADHYCIGEKDGSKIRAIRFLRPAQVTRRVSTAE